MCPRTKNLSQKMTRFHSPARCEHMDSMPEDVMRPIDVKDAVALYSDSEDEFQQDILSLYGNMEWEGCYTGTDADFAQKHHYHELESELMADDGDVTLNSLGSEPFEESQPTTSTIDTLYETSRQDDDDQSSNLTDALDVEKVGRDVQPVINSNEIMTPGVGGGETETDVESETALQTLSDGTPPSVRRARQRWQVSEVEALIRGIQKYGKGKWKLIKTDPSLNIFLQKKTAVDLKDKWRNLEKREGTDDHAKMKIDIKSIMKRKRRNDLGMKKRRCTEVNRSFLKPTFDKNVEGTGGILAPKLTTLPCDPGVRMTRGYLRRIRTHCQEDGESRVSSDSVVDQIPELLSSTVMEHAECTSGASPPVEPAKLPSTMPVKISLTCMTCFKVFTSRAAKSKHVNNPSGTCRPTHRRKPLQSLVQQPVQPLVQSPSQQSIQSPVQQPVQPTVQPLMTQKLPKEMPRRRRQCSQKSDYYRVKGKITCIDCGAQKTPQWREGPDGPRTLCNACGVRYKKSCFFMSEQCQMQPSHGILQAHFGHTLSHAHAGPEHLQSQGDDTGQAQSCF